MELAYINLAPKIYQQFLTLCGHFLSPVLCLPACSLPMRVIGMRAGMCHLISGLRFLAAEWRILDSLNLPGVLNMLTGDHSYRSKVFSREGGIVSVYIVPPKHNINCVFNGVVLLSHLLLTTKLSKTFVVKQSIFHHKHFHNTWLWCSCVSVGIWEGSVTNHGMQEVTQTLVNLCRKKIGLMKRNLWILFVERSLM